MPSQSAGVRAAREQLDLDTTPIPAGMGALLVPSLTRPSQEPVVLVFQGEDRVASGRTGERIVLPPGRYRVLVGHGPLSRRASTDVEVIEGVSTPIPPFFGAVRIQVVSEDIQPVEGEYVFRSTDTGQVFGPADSPGPDDPPPRTWLLPPGEYSLALGSTPNAERASAFAVHAGGVLRFRVVTSGGDLVRTELSDHDVIAEPSIWRLRWVLGGTGALSQRRDTTTGFIGGALLVDGYTRFEGGIDTQNHLALVTANVAQSLVGLDSQYGADVPLRTLNSDAELELLYSLRLSRIFGPYIRGIGRTSFVREQFVPETDVTAVTRDEAGRVVASEAYDANDRIDTFSSLAPTSLQAGVGLGLTAVDNKYATLMVRGGPSARVAFYRGGRYVDDVEDRVVDMVRIDDREGFGGELTAVGEIRLGRYVDYWTRFDSFVPMEQIFDGEEFLPVFRWDNSAALRLSSIASLVYTFSLRREEVVFRDLQMAQHLALRLQYIVF
ncbi:MAG TPA: hypothetical protein VLS89_10575 [Candidatus Nanopelagicales bacterium]|nr:hypothetical protein [Candidatus Nanopelagicales bacterium]